MSSLFLSLRALGVISILNCGQDSVHESFISCKFATYSEVFVVARNMTCIANHTSMLRVVLFF